jgi:hypothetical protein
MYGTLVATVVIAAATIWYAKLTYKLLEETKRMRSEQLRPQVALRLRPCLQKQGYLEVVLENHGYSTATDLKIEWRDNQVPSQFVMSHDSATSDPAPLWLTSGIKQLYRTDVYRHVLGQSEHLIAFYPKGLYFTVSYRSSLDSSEDFSFTGCLMPTDFRGTIDIF